MLRPVGLPIQLIPPDPDILHLMRLLRLQRLSGLDSSFADKRLTAQFKLRYKIGAYSDFYLVYNRGGELYAPGQKNDAWLRAISDLWQSPSQSLWTAKIRYAF